jgi:hypothetical protein
LIVVKTSNEKYFSYIHEKIKLTNNKAYKENADIGVGHYCLEAAGDVYF